MLYTVNPSNREHLRRIVSESLKCLYAALGSINVVEKNVSLSDVRWSSRILAAPRLDRCKQLIKKLTDSNISLFPFYLAVSNDGCCQVVTPPVLEEYVDEGGTRNFLLLEG